MIDAIYIATQHEGELKQVDEIDVVRGAGIVGDRNFSEAQWPGQNITFIEREAIARYNGEHGQDIAPQAPRRNIVTKGVDLNALVGKKFFIGDVAFMGVELCEPCKFVGELLQDDAMTGPQVVKALTHRAGLRADVLSNGKLSVGLPFSLQPDADGAG